MTIEKTKDTIFFGDQEVPLYRAIWKRAPEQPYRRTYDMKPGKCWFDMKTSKESEAYVFDDAGRAVPVGALVARHLKEEGADAAVFVELRNGIVVVNENLICEDLKECGAGFTITDYIKRSGKSGAGGFPDVVAIFPDGRIAFREIKKKGADTIQDNQHAAANLLRDIYKTRADLAIIEWIPSN